MSWAIKEHICRACQLPRSDVVLRARAEHLLQADRDLVETVLVEGQPVEVVARMKGMSKRAMRHRLRRLARRLVSRDFVRAMRAMEYLDPQDAYVAKKLFCEGMSQRKLAAKLGLTTHALRQRIYQVRARIDVIAGRGKVGGAAGGNGSDAADDEDFNAGQ